MIDYSRVPSPCFVLEEARLRKNLELMARYFKASSTGHPVATAFEHAIQGPPPDLSGGYSYLKLERMAYYVHKDTYRAAVRKAIASLA